MKRAGLFLAAACAAALLVGCGGSDSTVLGPGASPSPSEAPVAAEQAHKAQVYAAVIRDLVLGANGSAPDTSPYKRIWIVDHEVINAAQPGAEDQPGEVFGDALKTGLREALADLPPIGFISDPDTALATDNTQVVPLRGRIRGHGTIILLGPIEAHGARLHVGHEVWCAAICAEWYTSVLQQRSGSWVVTGETGPHAIT